MIHKMLRPVLAIGLVCALCAPALLAQTGTIEGTITDSETSARSLLPARKPF